MTSRNKREVSNSKIEDSNNITFYEVKKNRYQNYKATHKYVTKSIDKIYYGEKKES